MSGDIQRRQQFTAVNQKKPLRSTRRSLELQFNGKALEEARVNLNRYLVLVDD